ncbi:MAG TPA: nitrous oxide reductase accessory protein NosL [Acidobacteriota bacterium]
MNRIWIITVISAIALVGSLFLFQSCSRKAAQCPLCEREIHQGMQVKLTHNHIPMQACCMACALTYKAQTENVEIESATDFLSETSIEPWNAFYVVASDISPCIQDPKVQKFIREPHAALHACYDRCEPGILAFRSRSEAQKFQKEHGGYIRQFKDLPAFIAAQGRSR